SVWTQPLSSYRLPMVSETGAKRTSASESLLPSRRRDLLLPCSTTESGTAAPRTTLHPWLGFSKEAWKRGVAAYAAMVEKRQHSTRNIWNSLCIQHTLRSPPREEMAWLT